MIPSKDRKLVQPSDQIPPGCDVAGYKDPEGQNRKGVHESATFARTLLKSKLHAFSRGSRLLGVAARDALVAAQTSEEQAREQSKLLNCASRLDLRYWLERHGCWGNAQWVSLHVLLRLRRAVSVCQARSPGFEASLEAITCIGGYLPFSFYQFQV